MPVLTLILGAVLTFIFGWSRDQSQITEARNDERRRLQREEINKLQFAADELFTALYRSLLIDHDPVRAALLGLKVGEGEKWQERFEASDRNFRVHSYNVNDPELQTRIERFRTLVVRARERSYTPQELDEVQTPLLRALLDILEYSGERYQALM
jgi:hypothetical protein